MAFRRLWARQRGIIRTLPFNDLTRGEEKAVMGGHTCALVVSGEGEQRRDGCDMRNFAELRNQHQACGVV